MSAWLAPFARVFIDWLGDNLGEGVPIMRGKSAGVAALTGLRATASPARGAFARVLIATVAIFAAQIALSNVARASEVAYVDTDVLRLREGPSKSNDVILDMSQGEAVEVVDGPDDGWYQVDYNGTVGWTWGGYLSFDGGSVGGGGESDPEHWIDVNRSSGTVSLMVGEDVVESFSASLGYDQSDDGFYATANGTFYVYGMTADLTWTDWGGAYIDDWVAFDPDRSNGFHAWSMDENGNVLPNGDGATGGCVAMEPWAADELFNFASMGMRVEVHR
jgi:hypothetical protein